MADVDGNRASMEEKLRAHEAVEGSKAEEELEGCVRNRGLQVEERAAGARCDGRGQDEVGLLAAEIDEFSYDFDTYEYMDTVEDREAQTADIAADIRSGNAGHIVKFLNAAIPDDIREGMMEAFGNGEGLDESDGMRAKGLLDRLAEYVPHERAQEAGADDAEPAETDSVKSFDNIPYL